MKKLQFMLLFVVLVGCSPNQIASLPSIPETLTPTLEPTSTLTNTPSPSPSATIIPPTLTPVTPVPTLSPKEAEKYLLNLIESNGGCKLPCFLGIQPGSSIWEDIRKIEGPIIFRKEYSPSFAHTINLHAKIEKRVENFDVTFLGTGEMIDYITVNATLYQPRNPQAFLPRLAGALQQYNLPNVLSEYGKPSEVFLESRGQVERGAGTLANLLMLYPKQGIAIEYLFTNVVTQDRETFVLHTCLNFDHIELIQLYLQSPENDTSLNELIQGRDNLRPLNEITVLSIEDFYNLFKGAEKTICFDVP